MRRPSVAHLVVKQAREQALRESHVTSHGLSEARVFKGVGKDGKPQLLVSFPIANSTPQICDISRLLELTNLCEPFSQGFLRWGIGLTPQTRKGARDNLLAYFLEYLLANHFHTIDLSNLGEHITAGFNRFLKEFRTRYDEPLAPQTRSAAMSTIHCILGGLEGTPWESQALRIREIMPRMDKGRHTKIKPTEVVTMDNLKAIVEACNIEVIKLANRFETGKKLLMQGQLELKTGEKPQGKRASLARCLAELDSMYPQVFPDLVTTVTKENIHLARAIKRYYGAATTYGYLQPFARDLVPIVILLAVETAFNPDTILSQTWENTTEIDRFGKKSYQFIGIKRRSNTDQIRVTDVGEGSIDDIEIKDRLKVNPIGYVLALLKDITERIRPSVVEPENRDRLFIYVTQTKSRYATAFGNESTGTGPSVDSSWHKHLNGFCTDNNLDSFSLKRIRKTVIDMNTYMSGDIQVGRKIAGHSTIWTTFTHYTSDATKRRMQEELGKIYLLRERWHITNGQIDPRKLGPLDDKLSATPGFLCWDPLDSPRPNQKKGILCKAYGECPDCPLSAARPDDPKSIALYLALKPAIYAGQPKVRR